MSATDPPAASVPEDDHSAERTRLELKTLRIQYEKLAIEVQALKDVRPWERWVTRLVPIVSSLIAVGGFLFGVYQYNQSKADSDRKAAEAQLAANKAAREQKEKADETLRLDIARDTTRPLWDHQLTLYLDAAEAAATISTARDDEARRKAEDRFWVLYWGSLAAVEDVGLKLDDESHIEAAMVAFGDALKADPKSPDLNLRSLDLAHAIRQAIVPAFNVKATVIQGHGRRAKK